MVPSARLELALPKGKDFKSFVSTKFHHEGTLFPLLSVVYIVHQICYIKETFPFPEPSLDLCVRR